VESFLLTYGYLAVLVGTFLEGETILVLGGLAAHQGYLELPWVVLAAFIGSLCGDQLYFYLGRRHQRFLLARRPAWKARIDRINDLLANYQTLLLVSFRFLYGLRTVTPFVIGMSPVSTLRFFVFNALGALVWAVAVGTGGYFFGTALELAIGKFKKYEAVVLLAIALAGAVVWAGYFFRRPKNKDRPGR